MTEVEALCDPSIKKKNKKMVFDLNSVLDTEGSVDGVNDQTLNKENLDPVPDLETLDDGNRHLDNFGKKKNRQKKVTIKLDDLKSALPDISSTIENGESQIDTIQDSLVLQDDFDVDIDFSKTKKKKRKKKEIDELVAEETDKKVDKSDDTTECESHTWFGSDRDYTYDELLTRAFDIMREKNPNFVDGKKHKFIMRPPQVVRIGSKKTSFVNFSEICKSLHRMPKHLLDFLLAELGTNGSVDGTNQLIIKGRFQQKQIENLLRRYIKEYVTCHSCRSPDTILQKDNRLFFLQCESCRSRCSVASIKSGFQAVTGKRADIRAKTD